MEKHIVKLNDTQRQELEDCINKGKSEAYKIKHANILLKADVNGPGERIHLKHLYP